MCLWCCWKDLDEQDLMEFIFDKIWILFTVYNFRFIWD
jgi:hypothetical protein